MIIKQKSGLPEAGATQIAMNSGWDIPILGFGTYLLGPGGEAVRAVSHALEAGYRHIDTASFYGNEADVGEAVRGSGIPREEIFITTKLWNSDHGYEEAGKAFHRSQKELGLDYVDLFLIHWPVKNLRLRSWDALVKLMDEGTCLSIGVSNYMGRHLDEQAAHSDIVPAVNQVEFSPFLYQKDLLDDCRKRGIILEGYSPLTKGKYVDDFAIRAVAERYQKTPAQVLIRWHIQHGVVVLPKSAKKDRIYANADVFDFEITEEDMAALNGLHRNLRMSWDPSAED